MNSVPQLISRELERLKKNGWDCIYVLVDLHGTIFKPSGSMVYEKFEFYPYAKECLQMLSRRSDIKLILWTSTYGEDIETYVDVLSRNGIRFADINENRLEASTALQDFSEKFYFNVGIDDKFGFDPMEDWAHLFRYLTIIDI
jgi:hypothetical protein